MKFLPRFLTRPVFWLALASLVAAYAAAGFLLVPRLVTSLVKDTVREDYRREASLGPVRFNPFTLVLEAEDFALPDQPGTPPLLSFRRLKVDLEAFGSLWRRAYTFREIAMEGLGISLRRLPGGRLNLADLAGPPEPEGSPDEPLPPVVVDTLSVRDGQLRYEDVDRPSPFVADFKPLEFTLQDFSTRPGRGNLYAFNARFNQAQLAWRGTVVADPFASEGQLAIEDMSLPRVAEFLGDAVPAEVTDGSASLRGTYRLTLDPDPGIRQLSNGQLTLKNLKLRPPRGAQDLVSLQSVTFAGISADAVARQVQIDSVAVDGGTILGAREPDGRINLLALTGGEKVADEEVAASAATPAQSPPPEDTWTLRVPTIRLAKLDLSLEDRTVTPAATARLQPLDLGITGYSTGPDVTVNTELAATLNGTGRISASGNVNLDSLATTQALSLEKIDLTLAQPWLEGTTGITLAAGTLGLQGKASLAPEDEPAGVGFEGDAEVDGLRVVDDVLKEDLLKWRSVKFRGIRLDPDPRRLRIKEVVAREPYVRLIIGPDRVTNIETALNPQGVAESKVAAEAATPDTTPTATPASPSTEPVTPFPVRISAIRIRDGSTNFADFSTKPRFDTGIQALNGQITGLSSAANSRAKISLDGQVDRYSPVKIRGELNPLSAESYLDVVMNFRNVELAGFTPYSGRFAGYTISKGKMSADLNYKIVNRQLDAKHKFVIEQLELGDKVDSPDAASLPMKLAVALLKDRNGVIDLDLPVTGDLDNPKFRLGPIIWKVFVNLLTKIVTAPFALLGNLIGGGEELNIIDFGPGVATLGDAQKEQIGTLAKALNERPGLELNIPAVYNAGTDRPALARQKLETQLLGTPAGAKIAAAGDGEAITEDRERYLKLLQGIFPKVAGSGVPLPKPPETDEAADDSPEASIALLEESLTGRMEVSDEELRTLATGRAKAVQDALLAGTGIDPGRVFLTAPAEAKAEGGVVVMELTLR